MPETRPTRQTLSVQEAAQYVGLGRTKFGELIRRGEIPSLKVGARRLIPIAALDRWLESCLGSRPTQTAVGGEA
jgi:excisionase family DNA binding protein